jgi:hypothetical protein
VTGEKYLPDGRRFYSRDDERPGVARPTLQFKVPELVGRACLSEDSPLMGIGEKRHQRPWQLMAERQPPSGEHV